MDSEQALRNIAYVNSQITAAQIELAAMQAANNERSRRGEAAAYSEIEFFSLINQYQLSSNNVKTNLYVGR